MLKTNKQIIKIIVLFLMQIGDLVSTLYLLQDPYIEELNPIMQLTLNRGNWCFITVKLLIATAASLIFYTYRRNKITHIGLNICLTMYSLLLVWHAIIIVNKLFFLN